MRGFMVHGWINLSKNKTILCAYSPTRNMEHSILEQLEVAGNHGLQGNGIQIILNLIAFEFLDVMFPSLLLAQGHICHRIAI